MNVSGAGRHPAARNRTSRRVVLIAGSAEAAHAPTFLPHVIASKHDYGILPVSDFASDFADLQCTRVFLTRSS
jgi:hypothetical protein